MKSSDLEIKKFKRRQGKKVRNFALFCAFCMLCGSLARLIQTQNFLQIKTVTVSGAKIYVNKDDLYTIAKGGALGKSYFTLNTQNLENDLKANFLGAQEIEVTKSIRGSLVVHVTERTPIALLGQKNETFVVDAYGYVLGYMDPSTTNLPRITYEEKIKVGQFIDSAIVPVYSDIIKQLDSEKIKVSSISMSEYDVRMYIDKGTEVVVSKKNYNSNFSARLKEVLNYLNASGKSARSIDLRYDKVILSFN
jgi:cell division septal protein FtsQ